MRDKILTCIIGLSGMVWNIFIRIFSPIFYFPLICISEWKRFRIYLGTIQHYNEFKEVCDRNCDEDCSSKKCECFEIAINAARNEVLNPISKEEQEEMAKNVSQRMRKMVLEHFENRDDKQD